MRLGALVGSVSVLALVTVSTRVAEHAPVASQIKSALASLLFLLLFVYAFPSRVHIARVSSWDFFLIVSSIFASTLVYQPPYEGSVFWKLMIVLGIFAGAFVEEVCFRVGLVDHLRGSFSGGGATTTAELAAVITAAAVFALAHLVAPGNFSTVSSAFDRFARLLAIGIGFSCLLQLSGLTVTACVHALLNSLVSSSQWRVEQRSSLLAVAVGVMTLVAILHLGVSRTSPHESTALRKHAD